MDHNLFNANVVILCFCTQCLCRFLRKSIVTVHGLYCLIQVKTRKASTIDLNVSALAF